MMGKVGPKQIEMLKAVVATNGGGLSGFKLDERTMRSLEKRGLVQGKRGQPYMVVHTKAGLDFLEKLERSSTEVNGR